LERTNSWTISQFTGERRPWAVQRFVSGALAAPGARDLAAGDAIDRLGAGPACRLFYSERVEADAVHEQVMRRDVVGGLLAAEPGLTGDLVFGIQAGALLDERLKRQLLRAWRAGRSSLRSSPERLAGRLLRKLLRQGDTQVGPHPFERPVVHLLVGG
jgi:hypothetical protein